MIKTLNRDIYVAGKTVLNDQS